MGDGKLEIIVFACRLSHFSCAQLFVTLWSVAHQAPLHGILYARILEWVSIPFFREIS